MELRTPGAIWKAVITSVLMATPCARVPRWFLYNLKIAPGHVAYRLRFLQVLRSPLVPFLQFRDDFFPKIRRYQIDGGVDSAQVRKQELREPPFDGAGRVLVVIAADDPPLFRRELPQRRF